MSITYGLRSIISIFAVSFALLFAMGFLFANAQEEDEAAATPDTTSAADTPTTSDSPAADATAAADTPLTAEEVAAADARATELVEQDENITPEDLGVGDPNILPGNPLYIFKNIFRGVQSILTFDPIDKAELKLKFANEKIIEAKKLEEGGASDERVKAALENYEEETLRVKAHIEALKDSGKTKTEIERIVKHAADSQIKHHKALGKMMKRRDAIAPEIEIKKAAAMKHFSESMAAVVSPEVLAQKFEEALQEQKGSAFRHFKHIEVLEEVRDFVPEQAKDAIKNAIERSSKAFEKEFRDIEEDQRKIFNKYIEKIGGNEVRHLEVFNSLGAFADIQKEMFEEIEKAREKTRKRIEYRMTSIKDETRKQVFVAHLAGGELEDLRIIKELETNLDPEVITAILDIKHKAEETMRARFENAESVGDLDDFFGELEDFSDVAMLGVLDEMEQIIPEDKKEFWQEMKKKAMSEMQEDIDEARRFGRLEDELQMMAGFDPEHMTVLDNFQDEFGAQFDFFDEMRKEQAERIQNRFEHFREFAAEAEHFPNGPPGFLGGGSLPGPGPTPVPFFGSADFFEDAEKFRLRIQEDPSVQNQIEQFAPQITQYFRAFDIQREEHGFQASDINFKIKEAEGFIQKLSSLIENLAEGTPGLEAARNNLNNARGHVAKARTALAEGRTGEAFGQGTAAVGNATNGMRHLEQKTFEAERKEYFDERDKFRDQFRDLPKDERPDPSQFLKFVPKSFPIFEPPPGFELPAFGPRDRDFRIADPDDRPIDRVCAQVLTPARHRITRACVTFPDACIPDGWERVPTCEFDKEETKRLFDDFQFFKVPDHEEGTVEDATREGFFNFDFPPLGLPVEDETTKDEIIPIQRLPFKETFRNFAPTTEPIPTTEIIPIPLPIEPIQEPTTFDRQRILEEQKLLDQQQIDEGEKLFERTTQTFEPTSVVEEQKTIKPAPTTVSPDTTTFDSGTEFSF